MDARYPHFPHIGARVLLPKHPRSQRIGSENGQLLSCNGEKFASKQTAVFRGTASYRNACALFDCLYCDL